MAEETDESTADESDDSEAIVTEDTGAGVEAPKKTEDRAVLTRRHVVGALVVGLLAGGGGGFAAGQAYGSRRGGKVKPPLAPAYITFEPWNPRRGPEHAKVTMVVFTDFQCPFCKRALGTFNKLFEKFGDDIALVVKHHPLDFHPKAKKAAVAMLAAQRQGKAWEMHDIMFENRKELEPEKLVEYAGKIGLDVPKFEADLDDPELVKQVEADAKLARELGATGTPTTFVNGIGIRGARPYKSFEEVVSAELAEADKLVAAGTPLADVYETRCKANVEAHKLAAGKTPAK